MKKAFWKGSGSLTGAVPIGRTLLSTHTFPETRIHANTEGIKRGEETCQEKVRTWQPGNMSINNTVDKGLWTVFLKCAVPAFNGN